MPKGRGRPYTKDRYGEKYQVKKSPLQGDDTIRRRTFRGGGPDEITFPREGSPARDPMSVGQPQVDERQAFIQLLQTLLARRSG
jgi:hypothetical protein